MASAARLTANATMLTLPPPDTISPLLLFGMECRFTAAVLENLLANDQVVSGVILPGPIHLREPIRASPRRDLLLPIASQGTQPTVMQIAQTSRIPVYRVGNLRSKTEHAFISSLSPDWLLSACYPRLIPDSLLDNLNIPALNVHPSLLPRLRGPDPMFWTFHEGSGNTGVTVHTLSKHFDAGPIVAQQAFTFEPGTTEAELDYLLAHVAGGMLSRIAADLPERINNAVPQRHELATWARFPEVDDYRIDDSWSIARAKTFVRGVADRGVQIRYVEQDAETPVLGLSDVRTRESRPGTKLLRFADGHAVATLG